MGGRYRFKKKVLFRRNSMQVQHRYFIFLPGPEDPGSACCVENIEPYFFKHCYTKPPALPYPGNKMGIFLQIGGNKFCDLAYLYDRLPVNI